MERVVGGLLITPQRLSERFAKGLIGLSLVTLLWTLVGAFTYDGWQRVVYVLAIGSIGLGNLLWGVGSLLHEERGLTARAWTRPFFVLMVVSLPLAVVLVLINGA